MKEHYSYDEIYGKLISRNLDDTVRTYFVLECEYKSFYIWMYSHGWNKIRDHPCERNGFKGYKVKLKTNPEMV